jgi:hypothetical protein
LAGLEKASQLLEVKAALEQLSFSPGLHSSTSTYSRQPTTAELTTQFSPPPPKKKYLVGITCKRIESEGKKEKDFILILTIVI